MSCSLQTTKRFTWCALAAVPAHLDAGGAGACVLAGRPDQAQVAAAAVPDLASGGHHVHQVDICARDNSRHCLAPTLIAVACNNGLQ